MANWHFLFQYHLNKDVEGMQILITCHANYHNNMFTKLKYPLFSLKDVCVQIHPLCRLHCETNAAP